MKSFELQARIVASLISEGVRESDLRLRKVFDLAKLEEMQWERIVDLYMAGDFSYNPRPPRGQELSKGETLLRMKQQMTRRFNDIITIFEGLGCITRTVEGGGICATDKFAYLNDLEDLIDDDSDNGVNEEECQTLLALRQRVHDLVQQNDVAETTLRKLDEGIAECTRRLQETI